MKRPPRTIKRELIELRGKLRGAEKRYENAERELQVMKLASGRLQQMDAESKLHDVTNEIEAIKRAIKAAEVEMVGDWRPRGWELAGE